MEQADMVDDFHHFHHAMAIMQLGRAGLLNS
jgi:hypothetical protein